MAQISLQELFEGYLNRTSIFVNKDALSVRFIPNKIPHRNNEISQVAQILAPSLKQDLPSNLFLYGKTGTGKTVVTKHVSEQLKIIAESKKIPLKIIYVNCKLRKVADTEYRLIAQLIRDFGENIPATGLPTSEVYKKFYNIVDKEKQIIILILDEIDKLVSKCGDEVLYNLLRINSELKNAKISLVGISNDVTFKQNLDPRVKSSLGDEELIFPPYDALQLKDILMSRAKLAFIKESFDENVIAKCAAYAAKEHGDARRALDLLRVAGELSEREKAMKIEERHIDLADDKIESDQVLELVRKQPKQSLLVLLSSFIVNENSKQGIFYTGEIYDVYKNICLKAGMKRLTQRRVSDLIGELDMLGIISAKVISKGRGGRTREISLNIPSDTLELIEKEIKQGLEL